MKTPHQTNITLTHQRDDDFYSACCRELSKAYHAGAGYKTVRSLVSATLHRTAPQFYISHTSALRRLRELRRRNYHPTYRSKQQMWTDLEERVSTLERRHGITLSTALMRVLADCRAPRFYLSQSAGEKIFRTRRIANRNLNTTLKTVKHQ